LEQNLESWTKASPDVLGEDLLVVARQYITPVGRLDLLCIDGNGVPVEESALRTDAP
jgi:RecB family endonuclease NucS